MARVKINSENQVQRINQMQSRLKEIEQLSTKTLVNRPGENKWSVAEIIEHMYIAYSLYTDKLNSNLDKAKTLDQPWEDLTSRPWVSMLLKNFRPKGGVIKMKMKTQKMFEPTRLPSVQDQQTVKSVFELMYNSLEHLKSSALDARSRNIKAHRFNSAIGPVVRFNVPEAIEFILRHNERHMFQLEKLLDKNYDGHYSNG